MTNKYILITFLTIGFLLIFIIKNRATSEPIQETALPSAFYSIDIHTLEGEKLNLEQYKGNVILIVNVASKCGFTSQYEGLEALYKQFKEKGLVIIGVPSNNFGNQEPGTAKEIASFCQLNYGVSFQMAEKIDVVGKNQHPLFTFLTKSNPSFEGSVKWNFTKFLINKHGRVIDRFSPTTKPQSQKIISRITDELNT
jgi:glutathione peroxidase